TAAAQALARGVDDDVIVVEKTPPVVKPTSTPTAVPMVAKASSSGHPGKLTIDQTGYDFLQRARSASERGKMVEAVDNFRQVLNRQGGYFAPANLELSYALLSLKRYDEAIGQLLQVSQRDGARYPVSYFHLARVYELKGELKLAEAAYSQTVDAYG